MLDLPSTLSISYVFNVANLFPYHGTFDPYVEPFMLYHSALVPRAPTIAFISTGVILDVIDGEFVPSPAGGLSLSITLGGLSSYYY